MTGAVALTEQPALAYWYRLEGVQTGLIRTETDPTWSVADRTGTAVGSVRFTRSGMLQQATYWLLDAAGSPVVGFAEPAKVRDALSSNAMPILGVDGQPAGAFADPWVQWGGEAVGKFQVLENHDPHTFGGAWICDTADQVVATVTQTRTEGVGAYFQLDRPEPLPEPLATVTLALPLVVHRNLLRATERDIHERDRREERGGTRFGGEKTDLL